MLIVSVVCTLIYLTFYPKVQRQLLSHNTGLLRFSEPFYKKDIKDIKRILHLTHYQVSNLAHGIKQEIRDMEALVQMNASL